MELLAEECVRRGASRRRGLPFFVGCDSWVTMVLKAFVGREVVLEALALQTECKGTGGHVSDGTILPDVSAHYLALSGSMCPGYVIRPTRRLGAHLLPTIPLGQL